ncbi:unnamed protein product [Hymenolepis diminuta]|uniref:Mos1 transposase HTH domain-containing protein n=1 Tax=Hymenolepis diminuta TaxID=6216 RepID=A0A564Z8R8_HYMDI|nr:unnamed protein product [Hymenolepis diminuta]
MYTPNKEHIRHILLLEFHQGNTTSSAAKNTNPLMEMMPRMKRPAEGIFYVSKRMTSA